MFKLYFTYSYISSYLFIYIFIHLFICNLLLTAVPIYLCPPPLAPAICGRKWTLCKCRLLVIIKCVCVCVCVCEYVVAPFLGQREKFRVKTNRRMLCRPRVSVANYGRNVILLTMCLTPSAAESSKIVFISRPCLKPHVTWKAVTQLFT